MSSNNIAPEKITHPFQLMAAWFVMIIAISSILLTAAVKITSPWWAPGFLVVSSVLLIFAVIICVFLMLTIFRPHLQAGQEYSTWLRDERRFSKKNTNYRIGRVNIEARSMAERGAQYLAEKEINDRSQKPEAERIEALELFTDVAKTEIEVAALETADDLIASLTALGFRASKYEGFSDSEEKSVEDSHAIWLGSLVPPKTALLAIKTAMNQWPFLKYIHLSADAGGPDYIDRQIFIGGSTATAVKRYKLLPWSYSEVEKISDKTSAADFHKTIRTKYTRDTRGL